MSRMPISDQGLASQKVPEPIVAGAAVARAVSTSCRATGCYAIGSEEDRGQALAAVTPTMEPDKAARLGAGSSHRNGAQSG